VKEGRPVTRTAGVYDPAETRSATARARDIEATLRTVLRRTAATAPAVCNSLSTAGLVPEEARVADLERIPITRKEALPRLQAQGPAFGGWLGRPVGDVRRIFVSPGPIYEPEGRNDDYWGLAPALYAAGFRAGDIVLNTFSYHLTPAGHMFDGALEALGCVVVPSGVGNTEIQVKTVLDLSATGFIGTPSFLATIVGRLGELGRPSPLQVAFVSGEPLSERLRAELEDNHRLRISQGYATADVGLIAYECQLRTGLHLTDRTIVEVVDPATGQHRPEGELGEVVISYLSELYPLLRLGTGDLSRFVPGDCGCGRTAPRLERIIGRVGEAVKVRGLFLHPHDLERALARHPEIKQYRAVVTRTDHHDQLTVQVEAASADVKVLGDAVEESLREVLRLRASVEVLPIGALGEVEKRLIDQRVWT